MFVRQRPDMRSVAMCRAAIVPGLRPLRHMPRSAGARRSVCAQLHTSLREVAELRDDFIGLARRQAALERVVCDAGGTTPRNDGKADLGAPARVATSPLGQEPTDSHVAARAGAHRVLVEYVQGSDKMCLQNGPTPGSTLRAHIPPWPFWLKANGTGAT